LKPALLLENFPNTKFVSQDSTVIEDSLLVTDPVTVDGNSELGPSQGGSLALPAPYLHQSRIEMRISFQA